MLPYSPSSDTLFSDYEELYPYLFYENESTVEWNNGTLELPVAYETATDQAQQGTMPPPPFGQRQTVEVVQTSAPYGHREVRFHMVRWGAPPVLPDPTPGPNEVFKFFRITNGAPIIQPDGVSFVQEVRGFYLYVLKAPLWTMLDNLPGVATPAATDTAVDNVITPDQFATGLVDHRSP